MVNNNKMIAQKLEDEDAYKYLPSTCPDMFKACSADARSISPWNHG